MIAWPAERTTLAKFKYTDKWKTSIAESMDKYKIHGKKRDHAAFDVALWVDNKNAWDWNIHEILKIPQVKIALEPFSNKMKRNIVSYAMDSRKRFTIGLRQANAMRKRQGRKEIKFKSKYVPKRMREFNIRDAITGQTRKWQDLFRKESYPDLAFEPRSPEAAYFPHELPQGLKKYPREKSLVRLEADYADAVGRDIFDTNIIQMFKVHAAALRSLGKENMATALERHAGEVYGGTVPRFTRFMRTVWGERPEQFIKWTSRNLNRSVFALNWTWNLFVQTSSSGLTVLRYGHLRSLQGLDYLYSPKMHRYVRNTAYSSIVKSRWAGGMAYQDVGESIVRNRRLQAKKVDTLDHYLNIFTSAMEDALTGQAVSAAYHYGKAMGFEGRALAQFASQGGAFTQTMYNYGNRVGILRDPILSNAIKYQTFFFEVASTLRELLPDFLAKFTGRAGAYKTIAQSKAGAQAKWYRRVWKFLRFLGYASVFNMGVDKALGRKVWNWYTPFPFGTIFGLGYRQFSPILQVNYMHDFVKATRDVILYDNYTKLINWLLRYHFRAGVQLSHMFRGMEAVAKGGVWRVGDDPERHKPLYPIHGTEEQIKAILMGPTRTKAGKEYVKKRRESSGFLHKRGEGKRKRNALRPPPGRPPARREYRGGSELLK
jgi:hypothetical protein